LVSPFLKTTLLLPSLLRYWVHYPARPERIPSSPPENSRTRMGTIGCTLPGRGLHPRRAFQLERRRETAEIPRGRAREDPARSLQSSQAVKLIQAIVRPFKLDQVTKELHEVGVAGLTVSEVKGGYGRQLGHKELYRGAEYAIEFNPKVMLEVAVPDELATQVIDALVRSSQTGSIGDGKIFVVPLEEAVRVRNAERGDTAL
jgi:nitrogen regulatory protein PII